MTSRKRRAPGASPQAPTQTYQHDIPAPTDPYMDWSNPAAGADMNFTDPPLYDNYGQSMGGGHNRVVSLDGYTDGAEMTGQLVRRNTNQQLAPAPRRNQWDGFPSPTQQWETVDDDEELEQKAAIAKKDAQAKRKQIPPFVQKLSSFLDNNKNENLIRWSDDGNSFIVLDEDEFARTLIPELFKHNNYASFVRQLNMYGFHKKVGLSDNSMKASETKAKAPSEYYNKYFKRGRQELLWLIQKPKNPVTGPKRKRDEENKGDSDEDRKYIQDTGGGGYVEEVAVRGNEQMAMIPRSEYNSLRVEVRELQQQQKLISNVLTQIKRQNEELYSRATSFQALHDRHENSINAILTFLATFYNRSLEGNANMNLADMFPAARQQPHGNVVDVDDYPMQDTHKSPQLQRNKKPLAILPAPGPTQQDYLAPTTTGRATTMSPTARPLASPITRPGSRQSVFRPSVSMNRQQSQSSFPQQQSRESITPSQVKPEPAQQSAQQFPENSAIMSAIQNANNAAANHSGTTGTNGPPPTDFDYAAALSNYQTADGHVPLTPQQRNDVLSQIVNNAGAQNTNNALTNPHPPEMDRLLGDLAQYQATQQQLEMLQKLSDQQNAKIQGIHERILPLSPTGQISGLGESGDGYFGGGDGGLGEPGGYDLNMDSFVNDDDFFTSTGDAANPEVMTSEQKSGGGGGGGANGAVAANNTNGGIPDFTFDDSTPFDVVDGVNGGGDPAFDFADTTANGGMGEDDSGLLSVNGGGNGNEEGLEKLCKWHIDESSPWTFERFRFFQRRDPKIWLCQGATRHAREGFLAYARSTAADQDLLLYFRANDPVRLPLTSNDSLPFYQLHNNEERDTPEELPSVVTRNLYLALEEYSHCGEPYSQVPKTDKIQHEVRLCLVDRSQISGDFAVFDLHSLCSPPTNPLSSGSFGHWQQLRIHLSIKQRNKVRIAEPGSLCNFSIRNRNQDNVPKAEGIESLSKKEFCELLRVDHGPIKLCLQIKDQSIYDLENSEESDQKLLKTDSIPLAEVLNAYDLSRKRRLTLGYTLARSVWQYYNSDLANASWSATSVQFMLEIDMLSRSQPRITSQPCFVVRFQQEDDGLPECYVSGHITHRYPRIFSLGRLLFEIGQDSHHDYLQQESHSFEQETNDAHFSMKEQVRQKNWPHFGQDDNASDNLRDLYKNATLACLNNDLFKPTCDRCRARNTKCIGRVSTSCRACNEARHSCTYKSFPRDSREALDLGAQSRREILLEKVVLPLREALRLVDWDTSVSKPEVIPLKMSTDDISAPLSQMRRSLMTRSKRSGDPLSATHKRFRCNLTKFYDDHELSTDELTSKRRQYEEWKTMFMNTAERFPDPVSANASRLKIAVLDTGLDTDHPDIKHVLDRIWVYNRSDDIFGSCENSSVKDSKGHGTHIVGLVLEYTADADVYVADITEQGEVDHELVAKAILCAVKAKVDIISISFGFRDRVPGIEQAIEHAKRQGIHTLAAASNDGGNEGRSWPAKHRDVFCIHSTDAKGNHSKFNPTAIKGLNFATVGEAVVSSWPSHLPKSLYAQEDISGDPDDASTATKSGTSYATPIAACIVAFLLHFADMHLPKYALQLRKYSVMESVLKYVAGEERNGFNYLTLQSGPNHLFGRDLEDIRTAMKIVIDQSG